MFSLPRNLSGDLRLNFFSWVEATNFLKTFYLTTELGMYGGLGHIIISRIGLFNQNVWFRILALLVMSCLTSVQFPKPCGGWLQAKDEPYIPSEEKSAFEFYFSLTWAIYFVFYKMLSFITPNQTNESTKEYNCPHDLSAKMMEFPTEIIHCSQNLAIRTGKSLQTNGPLKIHTMT